jgi:uncharacterized repeat protein (TIGR03847 family)
MTEFDLPDVDRFTAGAIGEPGQRVFFLQATVGTEIVTVQCEKTQVGALGDYLATLLADLPAPEVTSVPDELELLDPIDPVWIAGQIGVVFDATRDRMVVRVDELQPLEEDDEDADDAATFGMLRVALTRAQVHAFVVRAATLVAAGRPPCPLCGRPIDPEGHMCIKTNGHKEH